jgi:ABC-2 type transport system permease protein
VAHVLALARRELAAAFGRPLGAVILAVWIGLVSFLTLWLDDLFLAGVSSFRRPAWWMAVCLLFLVPATTMRSMADERRTGTFELLGALPIAPSALVAGKWLGAVALVAVALALTAPWPVVLAVYGDLDPGPVSAAYLGLFLFGACLAAIGIAASASTESQVVAFLAAFVIGVVPFLVGGALPLLPAAFVPFASALTFDAHFQDLSRGVLDTRSIVLAAAVTVVALRVAVHLIDRQRLA